MPLNSASCIRLPAKPSASKHRCRAISPISGAGCTINSLQEFDRPAITDWSTFSSACSTTMRVLLVQLPIPPVGPGPIKGNVPLAAGYLKLYARERGLERDFDIEIFPWREANELGDQGLVKAILGRDPWMVGFTCYLWNIERTLWIVRQLKSRCPELKIVIGGPEVTLDNAWVLSDPAIDYAIVGEGEQTFSELLTSFARER